MAAPRKPKANDPTVLDWAEPLETTNVGQAHEALKAAIEAATGSDTARTVTIRAASRSDHLARQLVAAARQSAAQSEVEIDVTSPDGGWDDVVWQESHGG